MKTPRWYQEECVQSVWQYLGGKKGHPLIALPTATGKAFVIADINRRAVIAYPQTRILNLTHVHTLVQQNYEELLGLWPTAPASIYSAGLKKKDFAAPIIFGTIQSAVRHIELFGHRDLVTIDEAHLLSPKEDSMYQKALAYLLNINPYLRVIGLSATPYRMAQGMLTEDGLFDDICYDKTQLNDFNKMIEEGYLCTLVAKPTKTELDVKGVKIIKGEYDQKELEKKVDTEELNVKICDEICKAAYDRKSWLIFCTSIDHAEHVNAILKKYGVQSETAHSHLDSSVNDQRISAWKSGSLRCLVTMNMCTTGVNNPRLDFIGMLRPTRSTSLWVQMLGRGTRVADGKQNCLVLDFAGNVKRLGPINDPVLLIKKPRKGQDGPGEAPVKICEHCGCYCHASCRICPHCGEEFEAVEKLTAKPSDAPLIRQNGNPHIETFDVQYVNYHLHVKTGSPPLVRVTYVCNENFNRFTAWLCPEHRGFPRQKARRWWQAHSDTEPPETTSEFLKRTGELKKPTKIHVWTNRTYPEIMAEEF